MPIKKNQLKKFLSKDLKAIVKKHKLGKVSKKSKSQLIALIQNCDTCKDILSKLNLPPKKKQKPPSAKQLAARAQFKAMIAGKKKAPKKLKPKPSPVREDDAELQERIRLGSKGISELKDLALDKGLKFPSYIEHDDLVRIIMFGKPNLKALQQKDLEIRETKPVEKPIVKKALKEVKVVMEELIEKKVIAPIENKQKLKKMGKKAFLDSIFGVQKFSLKNEIKEIVNEATDEQLEIFLSFSKDMKKQVLEKRFNSSRSIGTLLKSFIK